MNLQFISLHIENFMSIGELDIRFDDYKGYNTIIGENHVVADNAKSNGSGKSSIFEAVVWCLTGDTIRGNKDVVNHNGTDGACVATEFMCDGKKYQISRYKEHKKNKNNLFIVVDGVDQSGKGIRDSEKVLQSHLPDLTASLIGSVIVLGQGLPSRFTNNTPSARKEVLETLTNSDFMIEDIKNRIASRKSELSSELRNEEDSIITLTTSINMCNQSLSRTLDELSGMRGRDDIDKKKKEVSDELEGHRSELEDAIVLCNRLEESVQSYTTEYNALETQQNSELSGIKNEHADKCASLKVDIATANARIQVIEKRISDAKKITDICPTCGQKLPGVFVPDIRDDEVELDGLREEVIRISSAVSRLREEYLVTRWGDVEGKYLGVLRNLKDMIIRTISDRNSALNTKASLESQIRNDEKLLLSIESDLVMYESKKASLESEVDRIRADIDSYSKQLSEVERRKSDTEQRLSVMVKFETLTKRDFRGYLLQDIIVYINSRAKSYCMSVFGTDLIDFSLSGNNISIMYNGKSYESLSGGERQKIDMIVQFAIRDMLRAYTGFYTNIIVLDEIFDNLDDTGSKMVIDLISKQLSDISSIFIISHHAKELNLPYDREIVICKDENGVSRLV